MPTRKTIVVPCTVNSRLKTCGDTRVLPAPASCARITAASRPAIRKNARPATTYMIPRRLWSTVTTHSWSRVSRPAGSRWASRAAIGGATTLMVGGLLAKSREVGDQLIELIPGEVHRRHEGAGLQHGGILHPGSQSLGRIGGHSGPDRRAAHQMGEIRSKDAVRRRTPHGVTADARDGREHVTPRPALGSPSRLGPPRRNPSIELVPRVHGDPEQHARVLHAAELGTLPDVRARRTRLDPGPVGLAGDDVGLAGE